MRNRKPNPRINDPKAVMTITKRSSVKSKSGPVKSALEKSKSN